MTVKRLHDKPIRIRLALLTESAANTFTERAIDTPVRSAGRGKVQAMEIMKSYMRPGQPAIEAAQSNSVQYQITSESKSAMDVVGEDDDVFLQDESENRVTETTAVGETIWANIHSTVVTDHSDGDGNGELFLSKDLFFAIKGTGNPAARSVSGYLLYFLVEIDGDDIIQQVLND